jgi:hypothetical protein
VDEKTRDADRAKAVQYYSRVDADYMVRAVAAFVVASAFTFDKQHADAQTWLDRAISMNRLTAPGPERDARDTRYRNARIANARMMTSDTTGP